jgi:hypothetical protein
MNLDHEVFCLGSTELAPPCFVPALFSALLGGAERIGANPLNRHGSWAIDFSVRAFSSFGSLCQRMYSLTTKNGRLGAIAVNHRERICLDELQRE